MHLRCCLVACNFWTKISSLDQKETKEADKSQVESSFDIEWSREEGEENEIYLGEEDDAFKTAVDFNDTKLQKKHEELESVLSLEAMIQKENERKHKLVLELNKEAKYSSKQPMSLDSEILLDQNCEVKDDQREIVGPKNDSNQLMSLDTKILLDQNSEVKDDQREIVGPKHDSDQPMSLDTKILLDNSNEVKDDQREIVGPKHDCNQPMSLDSEILLDQYSAVKDDQREIVGPKNDSNQPMSLETSYEVCANKDEHCSRHDVKVEDSSKTPVFSEGDLSTKKNFSEDRPVTGECAGAKGKIDLQASGIEQEKEKSSKKQEGSKPSKMKIPFLPFKKKGNTNH